MNVQEILGVLAEEGFVQLVDRQWQWTQESYPADAVSLRSVTSDNFVVVDTTNGERVIGETSFTSGPSTLHEKAIYLVEGTLYQVERFAAGKDIPQDATVVVCEVKDRVIKLAKG